MSQQRLKTIDFDEFQGLVEGFIERSSREFGEMPAAVCFELLFEKMAERVTETVEVEGELIDNQLVLNLPEDWDVSQEVRNIAILLDDRRIVVKLKIDPISGSVHR